MFADELVLIILSEQLVHLKWLLKLASRTGACTGLSGGGGQIFFNNQPLYKNQDVSCRK